MDCVAGERCCIAPSHIVTALRWSTRRSRQLCFAARHAHALRQQFFFSRRNEASCLAQNGIAGAASLAEADTQYASVEPRYSAVH
jgi:hypothetical protein